MRPAALFKVIQSISAFAVIANRQSAPKSDASRPALRKVEDLVIYRDETFYSAFPSIVRRPDGELLDTWTWFQSGINTDGAHNPLTSRRLQPGDILSLNCFPMISGYYTALERTLFLREVDRASLAIWEANVAAHEYGMSLLKPGAKCSDVTAKINAFLAERDLLQYRTFGYGHSFGLLSHYYGREAGLELREDIDTVLEPGMVISMEPMLTIPEGQPGAGGYREHDILVITAEGAEDITQYPYGPGFNVVG
jgi:creatinase